MRASLPVLWLAGCAASVTPPAAPPAPSATPARADAAPGCPTGGYVVLSVHRADGSGESLGLRCRARSSEPARIVGQVFAWGEGGDDELPIDDAEADRLWRETVLAHRMRRWSSCDAPEVPGETRWRLELDDGDGLHFARCDRAPPDRWRQVWGALEEEPDPGLEQPWPFDGEYWRDELRYGWHP